MYLLFFNVYKNCGIERDSFDNMNAEEIMRRIHLEFMLGNLRYRLYDMSTYVDWRMSSYFFGSAMQFEYSYNEEELDGGWWCKVIDADNFENLCERVYGEVDDYLTTVDYFSVGDSVIWNDPAIEDYEPEEREERLNCIYKIVQIDGSENGPSVVGEDDEHVILISDGFSESEVYANELKRSNC